MRLPLALATALLLAAACTAPAPRGTLGTAALPAAKQPTVGEAALVVEGPAAPTIFDGGSGSGH